MAFQGIDIRQTTDRLVFRAFLQDGSGDLVTSGTATLRLYELQSDGTLESYDFDDDAFKATALTTETLAMTHRTGNNGSTNTGLWTTTLTTLTGFSAGRIYFAMVSNGGASPTEQQREFQFGGAESDMVLSSAGNLLVDAVAISGSGSAADNVEANIGNLDAAISSRLAGGAINVASGVVEANVKQIDGSATNGTNATLNLKQLNIVNSAGDALVAQSTGGNGHGIHANGQGGGQGIRAVGGATGDGARFLGGSTSGDGVHAEAQTSGEGMELVGAGTGSGLRGTGGAGNGDGATLNGTNNGHGLQTTGDGSGAGIRARSQDSGHGVDCLGGTLGGDGFRAQEQTGFDADIRGNVTGNVTGSVGSLGTQAKADVNAEVDASLADIDMDHLIQVSAGAEKPTAGSYLDKVMNKNGSQTFDATTDSMEAIRDRGDAAWSSGSANPNVLLETTAASVSSQTVLTLTAGSDVDGAYVDQTVVLYDASNGDFPQVRKVTDYVGSTREVTIDAAADFTLVAGDGVKVFVTAPGTTAPTAGQVADAVWDEDIESAHGSAGSAGEKLRVAKAMVSNRRTHTVSGGVDVVYADDGSTGLRTMTPTDDGDDVVTVEPS